MSVMVVRIGPDARAGSVLKPLSSRGTPPPMQTAMSVLAARALPTTRLRAQLPFHRKATRPMRMPSTMPLMMPTLHSLKSTRKMSRGRVTPRVSSRMETATA